MNGVLNIHPKVAGSGLAGIATLVLLALLTRYTHAAVSASTEGEITLAIAAFGGWLAPIAKREEAKVLGPLYDQPVEPAVPASDAPAVTS